jgi:hypothetical protein
MTFAGNLVIDPDLTLKGHTRSNAHISFTNDPSKLSLDLNDVCSKVGHVRSAKVSKGQQVHL